jgi:methyl-accepting chemotaxis protein
MQWFKNLRTIAKLMLGFGLMAAIMILLGYVGVSGMSTTNEMLTKMYTRDMLGLSAIKEINSLVAMAGRQTRGALIYSDAATLEGIRQKTESYFTEADAEMAKAERCFVTEKGKEYMASLKQALPEYRSICLETIRLGQANRKKDAEAELRKAIGAGDRIVTTVRAAADLKENFGKQAFENSGKTYEQSRMIMIWLILGAAAAAIVLGLFLARLIANPLAQAVSVLHAVGEGDLSCSLDLAQDDEVGQMASTLNEMTTGLRTIIGETSAVLSSVAAGDLQNQVRSEFKGEFSKIKESLNGTVRDLRAIIGETVGVLEKVAARDMTVRMRGNYKGEYIQIETAVNQTVDRLGQALVEVKVSADQVATTSQQLSSASEEISSGAQEQASSLEETSATLEELTATVKQNADNARQANQLAAGSRDSAEKGGQVVASAVTAMGEINNSSKRIADIITAIDEIAFQTNLLALNAAVEAARAGEQGRGFAVVASEVRNLAQRSATAAKEIKGLIQDSVRKVENGSELVDRSGHTLQEIVGSVKRVTDIVSEIAAASQEQSTGIEQVAKAMSQMDQVTQANAGQTEELSSTAEELTATAEQLQALVGQFVLNLDGAPRTTIPAGKASIGLKKSKAPAKPAAHARAKSSEDAGSGGNSLAVLAQATASSERSDFEEF